MAQPGGLVPQSWDDLFDFLDPTRSAKHGTNRDRQAEAKCLEIMRKLVCFFAARGCADAEDLATDTILRVAAKCREVDGSGYGDRTGYFYGVAHNVLHESHRHLQRESTERDSLRRERERLSSPDPESWKRKEVADRCLELCVGKLGEPARRLIVRYYRNDKTAKIESHRALAKELGKSVNALRIEVHRIRRTLQQCVFECMSPSGHDDDGNALSCLT